MAQRVFTFVVVLIILIQGESFSQEHRFHNPGLGMDFAISGKLSKRWVSLVKIDNSTNVRSISFKPFEPAIPSPSALLLNRPVLSSSYYVDHLGFFCKQELTVEKITALPLRFRLGSLDYVNYLECKPNSSRN